MLPLSEFPVLDHCPAIVGAGDVEPLGNAGGFSGARLWRIRYGDKSYCLRRWPREHPSRKRLSFIHRVLRHVANHGINFAPNPLASRSGETAAHFEGHFWELTQWLPGEASYFAQPSTNKLRAALQALARFHAATSSLGNARPTTSRGIGERFDRLTELLDGRANRIKLALDRSPDAELFSVGQRIIELFSRSGRSSLESVAKSRQLLVCQQPCIRDVWHDHVLFVEDSVTGIVDFGALRTETVAADIARLLGSLAQDDQDHWRTGIEAYETVRPLNQAERRLIRAFDETTVLLAGLNWLEWIFVDGRQFDSMERILARLTETLGRLEHRTSNSISDKLLWKE